MCANLYSALSKAIKDDVSVLRDHLEETRLEHDQNQRQAITSWLTQLDFKSRQHDIFSMRQEGTGQWLLESATFKGWVEKPGKTLWCPGIRESRRCKPVLYLAKCLKAGAGKTILA